MERTLTEHQFHIVWTEAVEMEGYNKKLFQNIEPLGYYYGSPLFLSKNTGDTLTFKYIRKDRFYRLGGKK